MRWCTSGVGEPFPELEKGPGAEDKDPRLNRCRNAFQGLTKTHKSDPEAGDINGLGEITPGKNVREDCSRLDTNPLKGLSRPRWDV